MIPIDQYNKELPYPDILRSCYNCSYLKAALSWWCTNKEAINKRRTSIPGCIHCPFWKPDKEAKQQIDKNLTLELEKGQYYLAIIIN